MAAEAAEVLNEWRRAERLLSALPDDAPERTGVEVHALVRMTWRRVASSRMDVDGIVPPVASLDSIWSRYNGDGR